MPLAQGKVSSGAAIPIASPEGLASSAVNARGTRQMKRHFSQMEPSLLDRTNPATKIIGGQMISQGVKKLNPPRRRAITMMEANASIPIKASSMTTSSEKLASVSLTRMWHFSPAICSVTIDMDELTLPGRVRWRAAQPGPCSGTPDTRPRERNRRRCLRRPGCGLGHPGRPWNES